MSVEIITSILVPAQPGTTEAAGTPPGPYDLTDLATAKDELAISVTTSDGFIQRAITQSSTAINSYASRVFQVETVSDLCEIEQDPYPYQTPGNTDPLQLSRFPIVSVASAIQTLATTYGGSPATYTMVEGFDFTVDLSRGWLIRLNPFTGVETTWESLPVTVTYTAGYTAIVYQEAQSVPASPGPYTISVNDGDAIALDNGVLYASSGQALTVTTGTPSTGEYSVNLATGTYTFATGDQGAAVLISYLYPQIPPDIEDACLRLVTQRYQARGRDPSMISRSQPGLGEQRWWFGMAPGQKGNLPPEIAALVDPYRVPVSW
jgi:hypothetical protein